MNPPAAVLEGYAEIARKEHYLLVHTPGDGISEFFPTGVGDFFMNTGNDEIAFQVGSDGKATGLVLYGDGNNRGPGTAARRIEE